MNIGIKKYTLVPLLLVVVISSFFLYGDSSLVQAITVPTPTLLSPANQSNPIIPDSGTILLDWDTVNVSGLGAAEKYEVEIIKESGLETYNDGGVIEYRKKGASQTFNFTVTSSVSQLLLSSSNFESFSHGNIYRWRVRACSLNCIFSEIGPWSEQKTFITTFKNPVLIKPVDGRLVLFSPDNPITFNWNGVTSAQQYELNLIDTSTGSNAISSRSTSQQEVALDFSNFAYLIQKTFSWIIEPYVLGERDDYFIALQNIYPSDNIPSSVVSDPESFIVRLMPPTKPISPKNQGEISQTSSIELKWDPVLTNASNTTYQIKKPDGSEVFVPSNTNTLTISSGELCKTSTWEVRSCNENGTNCGPYPSQVNVKDAYPLNTVTQGPWEFTVVPKLTVSDFKIYSVFEGVKGDVRITATISSPAFIDFGDGSPKVSFSGEITHVYSRSKTYTISIDSGCGTPYTFTKDIDIDPPRVRNFKVSPTSVNVNNPDVEISWNVTETGGSGLEKVQVWRTQIDGNSDSWGDNPIIDSANSGVIVTPEEGTWWYGVHAIDNFGNIGYESKSIKVEVNKTSSAVCNITPNDITKEVPFSQTFNATESNDIVGYIWNGNKADNLSNLTIDYNYKINDVIRLEVFDKAGNSSSCSTTVTATKQPVIDEGVTPDNFLPKITALTSKVNGQSVILKATWSDKDDSTVTMSACDIKSWSYSSNRCEGDISCIKTSSDKTISCSDSVGSSVTGKKYYVVVCDSIGCSDVWPKYVEFSKTSSGGGTLPYDPITGGDNGLPGIGKSETPGACQNYCSALNSGDKAAIADQQKALGDSTCICNPLGTVQFSDIVGRIIDFILNVALVVAPITLVVAGFMFIAAAGDPAKITQARSIIIWTIVGIIIILLSKGLISIIGGILGV